MRQTLSANYSRAVEVRREECNYKLEWVARNLCDERAFHDQGFYVIGHWSGVCALAVDDQFSVLSAHLGRQQTWKNCDSLRPSLIDFHLGLLKSYFATLAVKNEFAAWRVTLENTLRARINWNGLSAARGTSTMCEKSRAINTWANSADPHRSYDVCDIFGNGCQLQVVSLVLANFDLIQWLTCQSRFVFWEHQESLVHVLGAWRKDGRCDAGDALWTLAKNLRGCRVGTCLVSRWILVQLRFGVRREQWMGENCSRDGARTTVDNFAIVHFDGVDRIDNDFAVVDFLFCVCFFSNNNGFCDTLAADGFAVDLFLLQITDSQHNVVALDHFSVS